MFARLLMFSFMVFVAHNALAAQDMHPIPVDRNYEKEAPHACRPNYK
jgi:hypothetical protein